MSSRDARAALMVAKRALRTARAAGGSVDASTPVLYSAAAQAASALPQPSGPTPQMMATLANRPGVKPDELASAGVPPSPAVTRDQLAQHFADAMPAVKALTLKEPEYGHQSEDQSDDAKFGPNEQPSLSIPGGTNYREKLLTVPATPPWKVYDTNTERTHSRHMMESQARQAADEGNQYEGADLRYERDPKAPEPFMDSHWDDIPNVVAHLRLQDRKLPTGEKALHMEELQSDWGQAARKHGFKDPAAEKFHNTEIDKLRDRFGAQLGPATAARDRAMEENKRLYGPQTQQAVDAAPESAREEIFHRMRENTGWMQKDMHAIAAYGAARAPLEAEYKQAAQPHVDALRKLYEGVPRGPYVDNTQKWTDLGLKHALHEAASGGYDRLMWTPGEEQTARYDLSTHIGSLKAEPVATKRHDNLVRVVGYHPEHGSPVFDTTVPADELDKHVGKDIAAKIHEGMQGGYRLMHTESRNLGKMHPTEAGALAERETMPESLRPNLEVVQKARGPVVLHGLDHKVGGEGMKGYYDNIIPKRLLALARQHDPSAALSHVEARVPQAEDTDGHSKQFPSLRITPAMRESILKRGFPAYARGGDVTGYAGGGAVSDDPTIAKALALTGRKRSEPTPDAPSSRVLIPAEGPGSVRGVVTPRHTWEGGNGTNGTRIRGMNEINVDRARVYGSENRPPLSKADIHNVHSAALDEHFRKPLPDQLAAEQASLAKLRAAGHIGKTANTLDKSEKLDTVNHEYDEQGRSYTGLASKGVAGRAVYTSGHGANEKKYALNTCAGQTAGCGGGLDANGIADTSHGTCFAPNAESRYSGAAVRRACHEQAKHDPAMTEDWILAHTGSLRRASSAADKRNKVLLFRPNVVDETDTTSRLAIKGLNKQRKAEGKPGIVANSYGKTNEVHDPENGYFITYSNPGPKVKPEAGKGNNQPSMVRDNIQRDKARVLATVLAQDKNGKDLVNEDGHPTPPKNSYAVTDVHRYSDLDNRMQKAFTHAKYWSQGRHPTAVDKQQPPEGHYDGKGRPVEPEQSHYGHTTHKGLRYDYQRQHILAPRLVQVGKNKDGSPHMIPTDSRFKDDDFLPKNRYMTPNGKKAGAIVLTTPTTSTSGIGHRSEFTHHVNDSHIEHALQHNGEYEIDPPWMQHASRGNAYEAPRGAKSYARGGEVDDGDREFPEQSFIAQQHNAHRLDEEAGGHAHSDIVTRALSLTARR